MTRPYLSGIINDHKIPKILKVYSSNEVIDYENSVWRMENSINNAN